jgi:hypothetical protein
MKMTVPKAKLTELMVEAAKTYPDHGKGKEKMEWVIGMALSLIPRPKFCPPWLWSILLRRAAPRIRALVQSLHDRFARIYGKRWEQRRVEALKSIIIE